MCTFCERNHNKIPNTKRVYIYDGKDNELGSIEVTIDTRVRDYQKGLYLKYPNWQYTKEN